MKLESMRPVAPEGQGIRRPARWAMVAALSLLAVVTGCFRLPQAAPPIAYYTLDYPPPEAAAQPALPATLRIAGFEAAPPYGSTQMFFARSEQGREAYTRNRWRARPAELVQYLLIRDFRESGVFRGVFPSAMRMDATHALDGIVESFYERTEGGRRMAVLSIAVTVRAEREPNPLKRVLLQRTYRHTQPLAGTHPRHLAEAMSRAMGQVSRQIRPDVVKAISEDISEPGPQPRPFSPRRKLP